MTKVFAELVVFTNAMKMMMIVTSDGNFDTEVMTETEIETEIETETGSEGTGAGTDTGIATASVLRSSAIKTTRVRHQGAVVSRLDAEPFPRDSRRPQILSPRLEPIGKYEPARGFVTNDGVLTVVNLG